jgi:hypothetical protein
MEPCQQPVHEPSVTAVLRTIGAILDEQVRLDHGLAPRYGAPQALLRRYDGLHQWNLIDHGEFVSLSWQSADRVGNRSISYTELAKLSRVAQDRRLSHLKESAGGWQELMRTLGQLLEMDGLRVSGVFEYEGRFDVAGTIDGESVELSYTTAELLLVSDLRRLLRGADRSSS